MKIIKKLRSFFHRNYHLKYNRDKCVKIVFDDLEAFVEYDIIMDGEFVRYKCLGKNWFILLE